LEWRRRGGHGSHHVPSIKIVSAEIVLWSLRADVKIVCPVLYSFSIATFPFSKGRILMSAFRRAAID
jgi:hypothetical protein